MKTIDIDKFLEENAVEVTVNGNAYKVKDIDMTDAEALAKEDSNKKEILAKILGCKVSEFDTYGAIGIMKIVTFLNENLLPQVSQ